MAHLLPRYFTPRSGWQADSPHTPAPIMQLVDSFIAGGRHIQDLDAVVAVDAAGDLQLTSMQKLRSLEEDLQRQIAYNEVSAGCVRRFLSLSRFYLFALQLLEQPGDSPGLNDPVYLYGKLFGVYPEFSNTLAVEGQLTVSRAEMLQAIVEGHKYAFNYAAGTQHSQLPTRCFHLMLGGDTDSQIQSGAGIVLVYPLPTAELAASDPSNEFAVKQIVFDLVQSLKKDLQANNTKTKLGKIDLPVPSRRALEMELESRGYSIKGNQALRKLSIAGPFDGVLERVYGAISGDRLDLPQEGSLEDFVEIARVAISSVKGWPTQRCLAVSKLSRPATAAEIASAAQMSEPSSGASRPSRTPRASVQQAQPNSASLLAKQDASNMGKQPGSKSSRAANASAVKSTTPAWMKDFMSVHKRSESAIITPVAFAGEISDKSSKWNPEKAKSKSGENSSWMDDFESSAQQINHHKTKAEEKESEPDWMSDFQ